MRGYFITGTDTDAGKTAVTASLGKHMGSLLNDRLVLIKPVQTGCLKQPDGSWLAPDEAALLAPPRRLPGGGYPVRGCPR